MPHPSAPDRNPLEVDPHGHAAMLLVESLIHALMHRSVLTLPAAIEIVEVALAAQEEISAEAASPAPSMARANALLAAVLTSLRLDLDE